MQIILLEKIINVGALGDVVKVKDGYARNFLIPQGKAKRATPENIKLLEEKRAELEKLELAKLTDAKEIAEKLEGMTVQVVQRAGVDGRLYGSVTNVDIVEALKSAGFAHIERAMVRLPEGPLKHVGDHSVVLAPHTDVTATITVSVLGDVANQ
ncbi:MAG: 50S ribosomal protein L9 [Burkholderiales bacterium]|jgi:large subunit ribosomal protein L9|nr:50S ribosomal protein L9 [Burkholderiales bacterium]